jgi:hypothetical protein
LLANWLGPDEIMASWREIDQIRKDPASVREIAKRLLGLPRSEFTDWEIDFLQGTANHTARGDLTTRQSEKLLQIRDDIEIITQFRGFSVELLLKQCHDARVDLSEPDETWIAQMFARNKASIRRKSIGRLMQCARELNIIEEEVEA